MIYIHFITIDMNQEEGEIAKENHDVVNTEVENCKYNIIIINNNNNSSGLMVDNKGWFTGKNKKKIAILQER